ncbi:MAG: thioesterase family protein [Clostridiales bacterium]|nr:thioesterase family protein [Clostridiales bacterium]MDY4061108.1 thioesterase family protein [Anaerovoracaceae bacterium]
MRSDCVFFYPIRVRYGEVDQQGVVYNGHYFTYCDVAFDEFLRHKGYSYKELAEEYDSEVCHKKTTFEYNGSAFEGDVVEVGIRIINVGTRSFTLRFEIYREGEEDPRVISESVFVGYDIKNRKSKKLTPILLEILGQKNDIDN